jgi:hypothetical protein
MKWEKAVFRFSGFADVCIRASPGAAGPRSRAAHRAADGVSPGRRPLLTSPVQGPARYACRQDKAVWDVGWLADPFMVALRARGQVLRAVGVSLSSDATYRA